MSGTGMADVQTYPTKAAALSDAMTHGLTRRWVDVSAVKMPNLDGYVVAVRSSDRKAGPMYLRSDGRVR